MKKQQSAGTPVSGPKHETNSNPRLDKELDALHLKVKGWSVNKAVDYLEVSWRGGRFVKVVFVTLLVLALVVLVVHPKTEAPIIALGLVLLVSLLFGILKVAFSHSDRECKCDEFYQTQWTCDDEPVSKLAIAIRLLGLASEIRNLELGALTLEKNVEEFPDSVYKFLIDTVKLEHELLLDHLNYLMLAVEREFGLLVSREQVFRVLTLGYRPERVEFVPKTFEMPAAVK